MKYTCVDPVEFLYPDITEYQSATDSIKILTPRGSYANAQVLLTEGTGSVQVTCEGWEPEVYEMVAIPVEDNALMTEEKRAPHTPEREAPFDVYDCLKPYAGQVTFKDGVAAVYFSLPVPADAKPGTIRGSVKIGDTTIPVEIEISTVVIPEESMKMCIWYEKSKVEEYHNVKIGTPEFERLDDIYHAQMRRTRINYVPAKLARECIKDLGDNKYEFDFSEMEKYMKKMVELGFRGFYDHFGYSKNIEVSTLYVHELESTSFEAYQFMAQFLPALSDFLEKNGWLDMYMMSVCDEPRATNFMEWRALSGIVKRLAPKIRQFEPTSFGWTQGYLDTYVVLSNQYIEHQKEFEILRKLGGGEFWYYDCSGPRGNGYINRFTDGDLLAVRYHGWATYAYDMVGYLHWAFNNYQGGQDPFKQSCPILNYACEVVPLPPGDTCLVYPAKDGPWISVRLENMRAGAEEYEMLRALEKSDKALADQLCSRVFHAFNDVEHDAVLFRQTRNELIRAMEKIQN